MATVSRVTGAKFRYDSDDELWNARINVKSVSEHLVELEEFVTRVATVVELLAWIADILGGIAARPETVVAGGDGLALAAKPTPLSKRR